MCPWSGEVAAERKTSVITETGHVGTEPYHITSHCLPLQPVTYNHLS